MGRIDKGTNKLAEKYVFAGNVWWNWVQMSASNFSLEALDSARHQHELASSPNPTRLPQTQKLVVSGAALRQLVVPHGWGNPAGRVDTPASPVLPLEGAGREARRWPSEERSGQRACKRLAGVSASPALQR